MTNPDAFDPEEEAPIADAGVKARYDAARTMRLEEQARAARLANEQITGTLLVADEVTRQVAEQIGQEIAAFDLVLRRGAEQVAARLNVPAKEVRAILAEAFRDHRARRAEAASTRAALSAPSPRERKEDF